jgi:hypothetical protein
LERRQQVGRGPATSTVELAATPLYSNIIDDGGIADLGTGRLRRSDGDIRCPQVPRACGAEAGDVRRALVTDDGVPGLMLYELAAGRQIWHRSTSIAVTSGSFTEPSSNAAALWQSAREAPACHSFRRACEYCTNVRLRLR